MTIDDVHGQMIAGKRIQRAKWANAVIGVGRSDKHGMWSETDQAVSDWQVME